MADDAISQYALDDAFRLDQAGPGVHRIQEGQAYWNFTSAFGGWALAIALAAIKQNDDAVGDLVALNAVFPDAIPQESLLVRTSTIRLRARTQFWQAEIIRPEGSELPLCQVQAVLSKRKPHDTRFDRRAPDAQAASNYAVMDMAMGPQWLKHYSQRPVAGIPFSKQEEPRSLVWIEEADGRPWDEVGLVAVSDTMMPRVFFADTVPRFGATVSYSMHNFAAADRLRGLGSSPY